jgi:hypothetical protein
MYYCKVEINDDGDCVHVKIIVSEIFKNFKSNMCGVCLQKPLPHTGKAASVLGAVGGLNRESTLGYI